MQDSNTSGMTVYREERFRVPSRTERELGLWVDRIGESVSAGQLARLRILGQFSHVVVLEGSGTYASSRYGTHPVSAGDCMMQCPDDPCTYWPHDRWRTRWITWNGPESKTLASLGYGVGSTPVFRDRDGAVSKAYMELKPLMQRGDKSDALRRKIIMLRMLLSLHDAQQSASDTALVQPRMEKALGRMHSVFNQNVAIPDIASGVGLSTTHFRRLFHQYTGRAPLEYLRDLRMAESRRMLLEGIPIKQVAVEVGYQDVFYFMRVFKKAFGAPPATYVREHATPRL